MYERQVEGVQNQLYLKILMGAGHGSNRLFHLKVADFCLNLPKTTWSEELHQCVDCLPYTLLLNRLYNPAVN